MLLDSYTSTICLDLWGRISYARALIEINAESDIKESLVVVVPNLDDDG